MSQDRLHNPGLRLGGMFKATAWGLFALMLGVTQAGHAESWYDLSEDQQGKTRQTLYAQMMGIN